MERSYTVLLNRGGAQAMRSHLGRSAFSQPLESPSRLLVEPPRPAIHRERLTAQELQELTAEPEFVAAAEIMCTRLLSPVAEEGLDIGDTLIAGSRRRQSWGIGAVAADRSKYTGADVTVALLDTGIDKAHPAFRDVDLVEKDFTGLGNGDADGHGTHCAGIIFGRNVDGVRIGVAPGVRRALIGRVLGSDGGNSDMLMRGMLWAHEQGAHVISMSVGFDFAATVRKRVEEGWGGELATAVALEAYSANLRLLDRLLHLLRLQEPFTGGAIIVAAAGNDSAPRRTIRARHDGLSAMRFRQDRVGGFARPRSSRHRLPGFQFLQLRRGDHGAGARHRFGGCRRRTEGAKRYQHGGAARGGGGGALVASREAVGPAGECHACSRQVPVGRTTRRVLPRGLSG